MTTTAKIGIGVGVAAALGALYWFVISKELLIQKATKLYKSRPEPKKTKAEFAEMMKEISIDQLKDLIQYEESEAKIRK